MFDFPSSTTIGSIAGTSVRSSSVVGRLRCEGGASLAGGREPSGTRVRGIIFLLSLARRTLLVGPVRRAPGCLPLRGWPVLEPHGQRLRWSAARGGCRPPPETPLVPHAKALRRAPAVFRTKNRAAVRAASLRRAERRDA